MVQRASMRGSGGKIMKRLDMVAAKTILMSVAVVDAVLFLAVLVPNG